MASRVSIKEKFSVNPYSSLTIFKNRDYSYHKGYIYGYVIAICTFFTVSSKVFFRTVVLQLLILRGSLKST